MCLGMFSTAMGGSEGGFLRSLDIAEPGPLDLNLAVALPRSISYFAADMLAFAIAIGPYDKRSGSSRLVFDVFGDGLVVLLRVSLHSNDSERLSVSRTFGTTVSTGASNNRSGGGYSHCLKSAGNSTAVRCPLTAVMVTELWPHGAPKS